MNKPKTYRFSTFQELLERVPADRLSDCLDETKALLLVASGVSEITRLALEANGKVHTGPIYKLPEELEWVDDGKGLIQLRVKNHDDRTVG